MQAMHADASIWSSIVYSANWTNGELCKLDKWRAVQTVAGREKRPIVEFALESAQAVRKMATKQAWQKSQAQGWHYTYKAFKL